MGCRSCPSGMRMDDEVRMKSTSRPWRSTSNLMKCITAMIEKAKDCVSLLVCIIRNKKEDMRMSHDFLRSSPNSPSQGASDSHFSSKSEHYFDFHAYFEIAN